MSVWGRSQLQRRRLLSRAAWLTQLSRPMALHFVQSHMAVLLQEWYRPRSTRLHSSYVRAVGHMLLARYVRYSTGSRGPRPQTKRPWFRQARRGLRSQNKTLQFRCTRRRLRLRQQSRFRRLLRQGLHGYMGGFPSAGLLQASRPRSTSEARPRQLRSLRHGASLHQRRSRGKGCHFWQFQQSSLLRRPGCNSWISSQLSRRPTPLSSRRYGSGLSTALKLCSPRAPLPLQCTTTRTRSSSTRGYAWSGSRFTATLRRWRSFRFLHRLPWWLHLCAASTRCGQARQEGPCVR
jgi:hypothetical protein